jgi:hypothetical protein
MEMESVICKVVTEFIKNFLAVRGGDFRIQMLTTFLPLKNAMFWDMAPCGFNVDQRFGGMCPLHLQGRRSNASEEKC